MALRFIDGFGHYSIPQALRKWAYIGNSVNFAIGAGRFGSSLTFPATLGTGFTAIALVNSIDNQATWVVGFAAKFPTIPDPSASSALVCLAESGTAQLTLGFAAGGSNHLVVKRGNSIGTILGTTLASVPSNVWCYIELKATIHNSTGTVTVRINGQVVMSLSGQDTAITANNFANTIIFNGDYSINTGHNVAWFMDDLYICDATGSVNNDFLGDIRVDTLFPNASGTYAQWTSSDYQNVDDNPATDDTDYISSATVGQIDSYNFSNVSPGSIKGIQSNILLKKDGPGSQTIRPLIRIGSTDYLLNEVPAYEGYYYDVQVKELSPATSISWTTSEINGTEFGVKIGA